MELLRTKHLQARWWRRGTSLWTVECTRAWGLVIEAGRLSIYIWSKY